MSVLPVISISENYYFSNDFVLRQKCRDLKVEELKEKWFYNLVCDMFETLYADPSGVGLAAPQIGMLLKLIVIDIKKDGKKPLVLINPTYKPVDDESFESIESCLSVPYKNATVKRFKKVLVNAIDVNGVPIEIVGEKFLSAVFQHEIDHLNGVLYIDKIVNENALNPNKGYPFSLASRALENINIKG